VCPGTLHHQHRDIEGGESAIGGTDIPMAKIISVNVTSGGLPAVIDAVRVRALAGRGPGAGNISSRDGVPLPSGWPDVASVNERLKDDSTPIRIANDLATFPIICALVAGGGISAVTDNDEMHRKTCLLK
jgi:hypothetical protein